MLQIPYTPGIWEWSALGAVIILIAVVVVLIVRKKKVPVLPPTPEQIARRQIQALGERKPGLRESSTELSLILRSYLTGKSQDPALFETHQEFNKRADALASLPDTLQGTVRDLLQSMAHLKYSPNSSSDDARIQSLFSQTLDLIAKIEQAAARQPKQSQTDPVRPQKISF